MNIINVSELPGIGAQIVVDHEDTGFKEQRWHRNDSPLWPTMLKIAETIKYKIKVPIDLESVQVQGRHSQFSFRYKKDKEVKQQ